MRDLVLLSFSLLIWGTGEGIFLVFQPIYLQEFGATPALIGMSLAFYGVGQVITHVPAGFLSDRFGPKPLMMAAWILGAIAAWTMALSSTLPGFIIGMMIYGTTLFVLSPLNSYITAARGKLRVGRAITLTSAAFSLGGVLGPTIGGIIGEAAGLKTSYLLAAVLFIFSTLIVAFIKPRKITSESDSPQSGGLRSNNAYLIYLGVVFVALFATTLPQPLVPNYLEDQQGLGLQQIGYLYSIMGVGIVVLNLVIGQLPTRVGLAASQVAVAAYAGILWRASEFGLYVMGFFLLGGYRVLHSLIIARTRPLVGARQVGLAYAWTETVGSMTLVVTPALAGLLYEVNPALMFPTAIVMILVSLTVGWFYNQRIPQGTVEIEEIVAEGSGA
jgi:MFS family permease